MNNIEAWVEIFKVIRANHEGNIRLQYITEVYNKMKEDTERG